MKYCPFNSFLPCREDLCGIWNGDGSSCAFPGIARKIEDVAFFLESNGSYIGGCVENISETLKNVGNAAYATRKK